MLFAARMRSMGTTMPARTDDLVASPPSAFARPSLARIRSLIALFLTGLAAILRHRGPSAPRRPRAVTSKSA